MIKYVFANLNMQMNYLLIDKFFYNYFLYFKKLKKFIFFLKNMNIHTDFAQTGSGSLSHYFKTNNRDKPMGFPSHK